MKDNENLTLKDLLSILLPTIWSSERTFQYRVIFSLLLIFLSMGINVYVPLLLRDTINALSTQVLWQATYLLIAYGLVWTLGQLILPLREMLMFKTIQRSIRLFCKNVLENLHSLPFKFHSQQPLGKITYSLERSQQALPNFIWGIAFLIIPTTIEVIISSVIICYCYSWVYATILLVTLLSFAVFSILSMRVSLKAEQVSNIKELEASSKLVDSLLNYTTVKYFHNQQYEIEKCDSALAQREIYTTKTLLILEGIKLVQGGILGLGLLILLLIAGRQVSKGQLQISDFILLNGYILQFSSPLTLFGFVLKEAQQSFVDLSNIIKIIRKCPKTTDSANVKPLTLPLEDIIFNHVSFGYTPQSLILNNLSFCIPAGKTTAVVGKTGVGKSTLAHLLLRFYDTNKGSISIHGQDIKNIQQESLIKNIGIVPQDICLFHTSIFENVLYGSLEASPAEVEQALKYACFDVNKFPEGINTIVGERGSKLSQGEKQRLALARLFLKNPALCILDECTSSLDPHTEKIVQENLRRIFKRKTLLIIAHRLKTIMHADQIIVLDQGKIIEIGTHGTLLSNDGFYASLWKEQQVSPLKSLL